MPTADHTHFISLFKKLLCLFLWLGWMVQPILGQSIKIDSLKAILTQTPDSSQAEILQKIGLDYASSDLLLSAEYYADAIEKAKTFGQVSLLLQCLLEAGPVYQKLSQNEQALSYLMEALELSRQQQDRHAEAKAQLVLAHVYQLMGDFTKSLGHLKKARKIAEKEGFENIEYETALLQGSHYYALFSRNTQAIAYMDSVILFFTRALQLAEVQGNHPNMIRAMQRLASAYAEKAAFSKALEIMDEALSISDQQGLPSELTIDLFFQKANIFRAMSAWSAAIDLYQEGLDMAEQRALPQILVKGWHHLGLLYQESQRLETSMAYFQQSIDQAYELGMTTWILRNYEELILVYERMGNYKKAFNLQSMYMQLKDSLQSEKKARQIAEMESRYELKEKQQEIALLTQKSKVQQLSLERQKATAYWFGGIALMAIAVAFVLWRLFRFKRKTNEKLTKKNDEIALQTGALSDAYERLQLLSEMGRSITSKLSIEGINAMVYEHLNHLMDAAVFGIGLPDEENNQLIFPGALEQGRVLKDIHFSLADKDRLSVFCFQQRKEVFINDLDNDYRQYIDTLHLSKTDQNAQSVIYLPLSNAEENMGVVTVQSFQKNAFTEKHLTVLRNLAMYIRIALENTHAFQQIEDSHWELKKANEAISLQNEKIALQHREQIALNQEKNQIISIVAHDLKNPVAVALSMAELIRTDAEYLEQDHQEAIQVIGRSLDKMQEMIHQILDLKRIELKRDGLEIKPIDMRPLLQEVKENYEESAKKKGIEVLYNVEQAELWVEGDHGYIFQIFDNLLSNAVKYTYRNTRIFFEAKVESGEVIASVRDEGPGISPEDQKKLFGAFQRLSAKPTGGEHSTGLGLSIVKKYVEALNGKVWCESASGKGATFSVAFTYKKEA